MIGYVPVASDKPSPVKEVHIMKFKSYGIAFMLLIFGGIYSAHAVVTDIHLYEMGEPGSVVVTNWVDDGVTNSVGMLQDSVGSSHWGVQDLGGEDPYFFGKNLGYYTYNPAPVSGVYAGFYTNDYQWGADFSAFPTDNFAIEFWVRTSNTNQATGLFATGKNSTGNVRFHCENGMWGATLKDIDYLGADVSDIANYTVDQAVVSNKWTNLAFIRKSGVSRFYIDGVYKGDATGMPTHGVQSHVGVFSKQTTPMYDGHMDHIRMFTFDPVADDPIAALTVNNLPSNQVVELHLYEMGEPGSVVETNGVGMLQDSIGSSHWGPEYGKNLGYYSYDSSPVSGVYAGFYTNDYQWGAEFSSVPTDNFAVELWVRTSNTNQDTGVFAMGKNDPGNLRVHCENGMWGASLNGIGFMGAVVSNNVFVAEQAVMSNKWTNLAVVRENGVSRFYIDGTYKGETTGAAYHSDESYLGFFDGQTNSPYFDGHMDHLRLFSFHPVTDDPLSELTVNNFLDIASDGSDVIVSWSTNAGASKYLETKASLIGGGWTASAGSPVVVGENYEQTVLPVEVGFFRLVKP